MAVWISWNIDIGVSLNSRDSFPIRKFKNRAPTTCSPGPILWPPTISFELHAKQAEEIDLEKCTFRNFGSSVTLTLDRVEVYPPTKLDRNRKNFVDVRTHRSSNLLGHRLAMNYKNCQPQSPSASNLLSSGISILAGGRPLPPPEFLAQWPNLSW